MTITIAAMAENFIHQASVRLIKQPARLRKSQPPSRRGSAKAIPAAIQADTQRSIKPEVLR
jgi:hypothetical protein